MAASFGSVRLPLSPSASVAPSPWSSVMMRPVGFLLPDHESRSASVKCSGRKAAVCGDSSQAVEEVRWKNKGPDGGAALYTLVADTARAVLGVLKAAAAGRRRSWALEAEKIVETGIINCRFFTLIGVAGTLVGSILCFVEGCSLVAEAFLEYFHGLWERLDQTEVMSLLIEAIDMFLVGSAMLNFGMGLYTMFIGSRGSKRSYSTLLPRVALGLHRKIMLPYFAMEMQCISEAKAKLGRAVLTMLQAGVVDKFKDVPVASGLDLACFAAAVLVSSAGVFILSRLHVHQAREASPKKEAVEVS